MTTRPPSPSASRPPAAPALRPSGPPSPDAVPVRIEHTGVIDSTNAALLRREALPGGQPLFLWADVQTHGRGRGGRHWQTGRHDSLTGSLRIDAPTRAIGPMLGLAPLAAGIAAVCTLDAFDAFDARAADDAVSNDAAPDDRARSRLALKWPNDVVRVDAAGLVTGKVGGVLCEARTIGAQTCLVIGIGLNLWPQDGKHDLCRGTRNTDAAPQAGKPVAGPAPGDPALPATAIGTAAASTTGSGIATASAHPLPLPRATWRPRPPPHAHALRAALAEALAARLSASLQALLHGDVGALLDDWRRLDALHGRRIRVHPRPAGTSVAAAPMAAWDGAACGIDPRGALRVRRDGSDGNDGGDAIVCVWADEVSVRF